ncbi:MAG: dTDP-3-amino-3,6-dideoxy-alpha-D-galactopyranose 3-N-acetyltransferase [candidate division WS2 bacterium]|nr:dTDP-3-amino-3,6-dideoxy-alpha-D-galactopyranose 3-N-acetyltransferase [Candidatus Psychracetigena formicireducens]
MSKIVSKKVLFYGKVEIGENSVIQDNVIIGSSDDGTVEIGENAMIRSGTVLYSGVKFGKNFRTGHNVVIRENTEIGNDVLVGTNSVVDGNCKIGNRVSIQTNAYIAAYTVIDDDVFMGPCAVTTNDKYMEYGAELKGPIIRRGAKIGANSTILPGVMIGNDAIVGAGSVVTKDVKSKKVVAGVPIKVLGRKK